MEPLRRWAETVIDTSKLSANELQHDIRERFAGVTNSHTTVSITSFGFSRGVPHNADLIFDMRFLRNPHWDDALRPLTGLDQSVADYVQADAAYDEAVGKNHVWCRAGGIAMCWQCVSGRQGRDRLSPTHHEYVERAGRGAWRDSVKRGTG